MSLCLTCVSGCRSSEGFRLFDRYARQRLTRSRRHHTAWPNIFQSPWTLYCGGGAPAFKWVHSDNAAINEIERRCHEKNQRVQTPANRGGQKKSRPKDLRFGTLNYSGRWSGMESVEQKKSRLSGSFSVLYARTPLPIVAHILPGRPVVVRPTLGAMGSSGLARYEGADACLSSA